MDLSQNGPSDNMVYVKTASRLRQINVTALMRDKRI